jgi:RNA polymerase sigma-70 factor (ECF subfamily)
MPGTLITDDDIDDDAGLGEAAADARVVDRDLAQRVAERNSDALAEIYDRHSPAVFGLAFHIVQTQEDAEAVVEAVFAWVWEHANRYDATDGALASWLLAKTRSVAIDHRRSRDTGGAPPDTNSGAVIGLPEPALGSGMPLMPPTTVTRLHRALAALPVRDRLPLELAYYRGLTGAEISAELGLPPAEVVLRIRVALQSLREATAL